MPGDPAMADKYVLSRRADAPFSVPEPMPEWLFDPLPLPTDAELGVDIAECDVTEIDLAQVGAGELGAHELGVEGTGVAEPDFDDFDFIEAHVDELAFAELAQAGPHCAEAAFSASALARAGLARPRSAGRDLTWLDLDWPGGTPPYFIRKPAEMEQRERRARHVALVLAARRGARLDRAVGRALRRLRRLDGVRALGFVRFGDYVREQLGQSPRWAQECIRLDHIVEACPALGEAHASGALTSSHLLAIGSVADESNQEAWIACAADHTVRELRRLVSNARRSAGRLPAGYEHVVRDREDPGREDPAAAGDASASDATARSIPPAAPSETASNSPCRLGGGDGRESERTGKGAGGHADKHAHKHAHKHACKSTGLGADEAGGGPEAANDGAEERWVLLQFRAPAAVASLFDHAVDVARRVTGRQAPVHSCVEHMLAEYASSHDVTPGELDLDAEDIVAWELGPDPMAPRLPPDEGHEIEAEIQHRKWRELRVGADGRPPDDRLIDAEVAPRPLALDAHLRALMHLRRSGHEHLGQLLDECVSRRDWSYLGFVSLAHYCRECLGISARLAQELLHVRRELWLMPELRRAYRAGEISWAKLRLLVGVCTPGNVGAWIERARRVTCRYLEREVRCAHHQAELRRSSRRRRPWPRPLQFVPPYAESSSVRPGVGLWAEEPGGGGEAHTSAPAVGGEVAAEATAGEAHTSARAAHEDPAASGGAHTSVHATAPGRDPVPGVSRQAPELPCRIRIWMPESTSCFWYDVDIAIAIALGGGPSARWERLVVILRHFLEQWDVPAYERWSAGAEVHRRFGWMCAVPGCTVRRNLESHHIAFRSQGGSDDATNLASLCAAHHRAGLHGGSSLRVSGCAPDRLEWQLPFIHAIGDVLQNA